MISRRSLAGRMLSLFFPDRCSCCGELVKSGEYLCDDCKGNMPTVEPNVCTRCGKCESKCGCKGRTFIFKGFAAPFYNSGCARQGIYSIKFNGVVSNAEFFGICLAQRVRAVFPDVSFDAVCFVPMSRKRRRSVELNHSELLARAAAKELGVKLCKNMLMSIKNTETQHKLDFPARVKNVTGAYRASERAAGKRILLVDDIMTTGATLNECAKQLMLAGAEYVYCAAALVTE